MNIMAVSMSSNNIMIPQLKGGARLVPPYSLAVAASVQDVTESAGVSIHPEAAFTRVMIDMIVSSGVVDLVAPHYDILAIDDAWWAWWYTLVVAISAGQLGRVTINLSFNRLSVDELDRIAGVIYNGLNQQSITGIVNLEGDGNAIPSEDAQAKFEELNNIGAFPAWVITYNT